MSYLDRLKALDQGKGTTSPADITDKSPSVSFVSAPDAPFSPAGTKLTAEFLSLIERIAAHFQCPPDELRQMIDLATEKPDMCWDSYIATARAEGLL